MQLRSVLLLSLLAACGPATPHTATAPGEGDPQPTEAAGGGEGQGGEGQGGDGGQAGQGGQGAAPAVPAQGGEAAAFVAAHNAVRATHCARPVTWSPKIAEVAQAWANTLRDRNCAFEHSRGNYGENLAAGSSGALDPAAVVKMWTDEEQAYDPGRPGFSMQTGHFTQVVWAGTTQIGCGHSTCGGMDIYVCNYDPPGNYEGDFPANVHMAGCK